MEVPKGGAVSQEAPAPAPRKPFMMRRTGVSGLFPPPSRTPVVESETRHSDATPTPQPPVSEEPSIMHLEETIHVGDKKASKRLSNVPPPEIQREFDTALNSESYPSALKPPYCIPR